MDTNSPWLSAPLAGPKPRRLIRSPPSNRAGRSLGCGAGRRRIGAGMLALLAKFKAVILLLPKLKLFASTGTILVSLAAYALLWGWPFAAGFIALLFVHEMGHVIALRREGLKASAPMFIPFMGAVIAARSLGRNALAEARVGLAGPILGSIGAAACILVWQATGTDMWRALAFTGFFLNLFNLLPVVPLDGGRAMAAMAPWMWFVGFAAMIPLAILFPNPIILLILVFAGFETYKRWKLRRTRSPEQEAYYRVRPCPPRARRRRLRRPDRAAGRRNARHLGGAHDQLVASYRSGRGRRSPDHALLVHILCIRVAPCPPEGVDQRQHEPDEPDHEQDGSGSLDVEPVHVCGHGPLQDRASGDQHNACSNCHGMGLPNYARRNRGMEDLIEDTTASGLVEADHGHMRATRES